MILLDTDHISVFRYRNHSLYLGLASRLLAALDRDLAVSVISLEEQMRGWLAEIKRRKHGAEQIPVYTRLSELIEFYHSWQVAAFDEAAASQFDHLSRLKLRVGPQDLKIAAIALVNHAMLLTSNLRDFSVVPNLKVEDWLYGHRP